MNEQEHAAKKSNIDALIEQFHHLDRRMKADSRAISEIYEKLQELSDSTTLAEIHRKLKSLSDQDRPTAS